MKGSPGTEPLPDGGAQLPPGATLEATFYADARPIDLAVTAGSLDPTGGRLTIRLNGEALGEVAVVGGEVRLAPAMEGR